MMGLGLVAVLAWFTLNGSRGSASLPQKTAEVLAQEVISSIGARPVSCDSDAGMRMLKDTFVAALGMTNYACGRLDGSQAKHVKQRATVFMDSNSFELMRDWAIEPLVSGATNFGSIHYALFGVKNDQQIRRDAIFMVLDQTRNSESIVLAAFDALVE